MSDQLSVRVVSTLAALSVLALSGGSCAPADDRPPPNVIVISLDTLRYDHCGFNGYERDTTPFLDKLATESIVFDRAYTTMSWTLIAHMSMLTGLYPTQHGVMESDLALTPGFPTLAQRLHSVGYTTLGVRSSRWLDGRFGFDRGFDSYPKRARDAIAATEDISMALETVREGWPYFLFVHLFDIHSMPLDVPGSTLYAPPPPFDSMWVEGAKKKLEGIDTRKVWDGLVDPTNEQHEAIIALYDGGIRYADNVLEGWFAEWEELGLLDNTLIIITSDHGESLRQRGRGYGGHGGLNEEGLRVPLLVRLPGGARGGERVDNLSSLVDLVPTILDVLGLDEDDRLPGYSLVGEGRPEDDWVFAAQVESRAAISHDRKILYSGTSAHRLVELDEDPEEVRPLAPWNDEVQFRAVSGPLLDSATARLNGLFQPDPAVTVGELDEKAKEHLKALGYAGEIGK